MAITLETVARNAACDAIVDLVDGGTSDTAGDFHFRDSSTTIVTIEVDDPAFGAASTGVATLAGVPHTAVAVAAAADPGVDNFQLRDRDNAVILSGSCTGAGGGGDIEFDNPIIAVDQNINLTAFTLTVPAS